MPQSDALTDDTAAHGGFLRKFGDDGYYLASEVLNRESCLALNNRVQQLRGLGRDLFMSEEEYNAGPRSHFNTNPIPGRNILEPLEKDVAFVQQTPAVNELLSALLGDNFRWFYRKLVCRVPRSAMPDWVLRGIQNGPTTTLGAYVKPEYRDIAYYHDNELHQDIMDYARMPQDIKEHRLVTMYVYLTDVGMEDAPTCVMPGSHRLGANPFPYDVRRRDGTNSWLYTDARGHTLETAVKPVATRAGSLLLWHSCLLHGARPIPDGRWRYGIRYMIACEKGGGECALDRINRRIEGPLYLEKDYTSHQKAGADGFIVLPQSDFARTYFDPHQGGAR